MIYGVSLCQTGEALGHDMLVDEIMLGQIVDAVAATGNAGLKSRFTHPGACSDAMGKMLGKVKNARLLGDKAVADLYLAKHASKTPEGDLAEYVMAMADESPADFGMSIAFDGSAVWKDADGKEFAATTADGNRAPRPADATTAKPFARVSKLRAADIVDEPAANRDGLFAAAFSGTTNMAAAEMFAALDEARDAIGWDDAKTAAFLQSYLSARKITMAEEPAAPVEPVKLATECATCGAPIGAEGKYAAPAEKPMQPAEMSAMIESHPAFAAQIAKDFAAGKSTQAVQLGVLTAQLAASVTALAAAADALAAEKTAHAKTADRLAKLSALSGSAIDPGAAPVSGTPVKSDDQIKAAWSALPDAERAAFLGDFETYRYHVTNQSAAKPGAQE